MRRCLSLVIAYVFFGSMAAYSSQKLASAAFVVSTGDARICSKALGVCRKGAPCLRGMVVGLVGEPLAGVDVSLAEAVFADGGLPLIFSDEPSAAKTDATGHFEFPAPVSSRAVVYVMKSGYVSAQVTIRAKETSCLEFILAPKN